MTKPEYFDGTEWKSFCSEGAPVNIENATSSPFPITGSLIVSEGSINVDLGPELDALAVFNQNGLVTRTGDGTYAGRELIAGNGIEIENGNGVNGNPIISAIALPDPFINDLPINGNLDLESFDLITTGDVSVQNGAFIGNNLRAYDTNSIFVNSSFDMQGKSISNLLTPTNPNDAATKNYVDTVINSPFINDLPINGNLDLESFDLITTGDVNAQNVNAQYVTTQFITASSNTNLGVVFNSQVQMQNNPIFGLPFLIVGGDISCRENTFIGNNIAAFNSTNIAVFNNLDLQNNRIIDLALPTDPNDAVPKQYVDNNTSWYLVNPTDVVFNTAISITGFFSQDISYGYLNSSGAVGTASGLNNYSLDCTNRIKASEFNAYSSIKKKRILSKNKDIEDEAVKLLKQIPFFKYEYKDKRKEGNGISYGVIAESLYEILPEYVDMESKDVVPNILSKGTLEKITNNSFNITLKKSDFSIDGNILNLITSKGKIEATIIKIDKNIITISSQEELEHQTMEGEIYVYGTFEKCPAVSKQKLFELNMVVTKNLLSRVDELEYQLTKMRKK